MKQPQSVELRPVTTDNWQDVIKLNVHPHQSNLVGPNVRSLAEAYVRDDAACRAVYSLEGDLVGFMMWVTEAFDGKRHIHRFMIDARYQGKGYGHATLAETVKIIWGTEGYDDDIMIMFLTHNDDAEKHYRSFGFEDTGEIIVDEKLFILPLSRRADYV